MSRRSKLYREQPSTREMATSVTYLVPVSALEMSISLRFDLAEDSWVRVTEFFCFAFVIYGYKH